MVFCRVVMRNEEKWMWRMDEKSNKKEEDKLVNFSSLLSLESSTCGWTRKKQYFTAFSKSRSYLNKMMGPTCFIFLACHMHRCVLKKHKRYRLDKRTLYSNHNKNKSKIT